MLKQLEIKNFQAYEDSAIQFADGLTVLVGENNTGKTAIFRSLKWLCRNRPRGDSLIRHGTKQATVTLSLEDTEIIRTKSRKGKNEYQLDGETFKALGADVPQEVIDRLGLTDINWQDQLDGPFLVLDSPGQIASAINDVTHLDEPAGAVDSLSSQIRELDRTAKNLKERQEALQADLRPFKRLDQYGSLLTQLKAVHGKLEASTAILSGIGDVVEAIEAVERDIKRTKLPDRLGQVVDEYERGNVRYDKTYNDCADLAGIVEDLLDIEKQLAKIPDTEAADKIWVEADKSEKTVRYLETEMSALDSWLRDIVDTEDLIDEIKVLRAERGMAYQELLEEIEVCPACERPVDDEQRALVVEYLT